MPLHTARRSSLPGFRTTMTFTVLYLIVIVIVPLLTLPVKSFGDGWEFFWNTIRDPRVVASYRLTIGASFVAALVNALLGIVVAWVLVRYHLPDVASSMR